MAERITDSTQLNVNTLIFCAPKATAQGAKSVNILNPTTKTGLTLSTPLLLTWGASDYKAEGEEKGNGKFEMSLQFPTPEYANDDTRACLEKFKELEDKIKANALIYSKEWFGKVHKSSEVVDALWTPMLKYQKDKITGEPDHSKMPTIRVKLPQWEGVWKSEIYDEDANKLFPSADGVSSPLDFLKKGSNVMCIIQFGGIWFINGKFSANWKLVQAMVQKPRATLQGQCFIKAKPQDKEKLKTQVVVDENDHIASSVVDDSDEDEDEDEVVLEKKVVPPPAPAPVAPPATQEEPVKKRIVKKKE